MALLDAFETIREPVGPVYLDGLSELVEQVPPALLEFLKIADGGKPKDPFLAFETPWGGVHAWDPIDAQGYGEQWWVADDEFGTFFCSGYEGQRIACVPALDLVVVRLGKTPAELGPQWRHRLGDLIECFAG